MNKFLLLLLCLLPALAHADASVPSVEDNIRAMDSDHDGQVTVSEIRAFLEAKYGKGYQQALLESMEEKAGTKSCPLIFSRPLY